MNILYLTYDGLSDQLGQSQILPYLKGLAALGYSITIVSCEKKERYKKTEIALREELQSIEWQPVFFARKPPVISTVYNLGRMLLKARFLSRKKPYAIVHCRSTLAALIGLKVKKEFGSKLLFDMRGFWADERVEGKLWPLNNPFYRIIYKYVKACESKLLLKSDHVISLTQEGKKIIENAHNSRLPPVTVIPCCADEQLFNPSAIPIQEIKNTKKTLSVSDTAFIIIYTGSIGTWYMLTEMLQFFNVLNSAIKDSVFLFITKENPELIFNEAEKLHIAKEKIRVRSAERKEIPLYFALADASVFFIRPGFSKKASSPVKMGESLMMGIPVICNSGIGDNDTIIGENRLGWVIQGFDESGYREVVLRLRDKKDAGDLRTSALQIFSLSKGIRSYDGVYASLLNQ